MCFRELLTDYFWACPNTTVGSFYLMQFVGNLLVAVVSCLYSCKHEDYYPILLLLYLGISVMGTNTLCHRSVFFPLLPLLPPFLFLS